MGDANSNQNSREKERDELISTFDRERERGL